MYLSDLTIYTRAVYKIAQEYTPATRPDLAEDLAGEGFLALAKAAQTYDGKTGGFTGYAKMHIRYAMQDLLRKEDHLSRWQRQKVNAGQSEDVGRPLSLEFLQEAAPSLLAALRDSSPDVLSMVIAQEEYDVLHRYVKRLPMRESVVIREFYFKECTDKQIGQQLGVTPSRTQQIRRQALHRLKTKLTGLLEP